MELINLLFFDSAMSFKYSICYPDKPDIEFVESEIEANDIVELVKSFNWNEEGKKQIEFYSISLDFVRIKDKHRLIISCVVENEIEIFQVTYIIPNDTNSKIIFDEKNYFSAEEYSAENYFAGTLNLLQKYLEEDYPGLIDEIKSSTKLIKPKDHDNTNEKLPKIITIPVNPGELDQSQLDKIIENSGEPHVSQELTVEEINRRVSEFGGSSKQILETEDHSNPLVNLKVDNSTNNYREVHSSGNEHLPTVFSGLIVTILFVFLTIEFSKSGSIDVLTILFGMLSLFFGLGTIHFGLRRN